MLPHQEIFEVLKVGSVILVDDGKIKLEVIEAVRDQINTKVLVTTVANSIGVFDAREPPKLPIAVLAPSTINISFAII